jgi:TM2 domain-containing membrane protein YozV
MDSADDTKACPLCGETIKAVAIRCKHCQADLSAYKAAPTVPEFDRGAVARGAEAKPDAKISKPNPYGPTTDEAEFERRFLDFAYETHEKLTPISVAHALKLPIAFCDQRLESLAAGDVICREVDDEGNVYFELPGGRPHKGTPGALIAPMPGMPPGTAIVHVGDAGVRSLTRTPSGPPPTEAQAVVGLVLNLCIPGAGSLVAGKSGPGVAQLAMLIAGLPLCFVIVGFPIVFAAWLWALMTGVQAMQEAKGLSGPQ